MTTSMADALLDATRICLERDPKVFVLGEGVADPKGIFGTTVGLVDQFGPERVMEMPVSENGFTGMAIGAALMGQRPLMVHQRVDFALLALEQIFNNAAKTRYVTCGAHSVPVVVRMIVGRGWGQGPEHSQSLESVFAHIPGLKVVMPAMPGDAKGMLIAAVEDDDPVIFIEHRWCHYAMAAVPDGYVEAKLDGPATLKTGSDLTIAAYSYNVYEALQAAEALERVGISAEVLDLRIIRPLNLDPVLDSVRRTGRLLTLDTGWRMFGVGAEIVSSVVEQAMPSLRSAPVRLGLPDHPTPSSRALVTHFYPNSVEIIRRAGAMLDIDVSAEVTRVQTERESTPIDVPNPAFKGPF